MTTAGQDFFDKNWFKDHTVFLFDCPVEDLIWYVDIRPDLLDEWAKQNNSSDIEVAKCVTIDFSAKILPLPLEGDNQVLHHFEKVVWLIQSYCQGGWKNSIKAVNHLDNGKFIVHPGTNRCIAAKFLRCKFLPIMLSVHKDQELYKQLVKTAKEINNEQDLRKELNSPNPILFRTEIEDRLFVNGRRVEGKYFKDFTYEFLGKDAWPERTKFKQWRELVFNNLPLHVYYTENVDPNTIHTNIQDERFQIIKNGADKLPHKGVHIMLDKSFNRDIFDLLFLLDPETSLTSKDGKIKIVNNAKKEIIIPEHFLNDV